MHIRHEAPDPVWLHTDRLVIGQSLESTKDTQFDVPLVSDLLAQPAMVRYGTLPGPLALNPNPHVDPPLVQLQRLSAKYGIAPIADVNAWQKAVVRAVITDEARRQGISPALPLSVAYHESGMKMWSDVRSGTVMRNDNLRNGSLSSSDFGVMQVNNRAHAKQFPVLGQDMEANIRYGVALLARIDRNYGQDLGLGLGRWDATYVVYGLGHVPQTASEWKWARSIAGQFKKILPQVS